MSEFPLCGLCGVEVNPGGDTYVEERGWARHRTGGGLHQLALREETGRFAHRECVDLRRHGVSPDQEILL